MSSQDWIKVFGPYTFLLPLCQGISITAVLIFGVQSFFAVRSHPVLCKVLSSILGLHPPDASSMLDPNCDHQKCFQPLPMSPGGKITLSWKTLLYNMARNLGSDPLKQQTSFSMNMKSMTSDFLNAKLPTSPAHPSTLSLRVPTVISCDVFCRDLLKHNQRQERGEWKLSPGT